MLALALDVLCEDASLALPVAGLVLWVLLDQGQGPGRRNGANRGDEPHFVARLLHSRRHHPAHRLLRRQN